jgi:hypothetical protein
LTDKTVVAQAGRGEGVQTESLVVKVLTTFIIDL